MITTIIKSQSTQIKLKLQIDLFSKEYPNLSISELITQINIFTNENFTINDLNTINEDFELESKKQETYGTIE